MRGVRVLVVDDQAPFRQAAAAVVAAVEGFELVGTADTGEAAVAAVAVHRPDLVVMDVCLPGISGPEAARRITGDPGSPTVRVLLVSTYEARDLDELAPSGVVGFLSKASFDPESLQAAWAELTG
jgi:CheY-like chemotaxis protein